MPGYAVMFTFFIMISMVTSFIKDQRSGMLSRLAATPLAPLQYLGGKWIAFITIVFLQVVILLLFGYFVYDITLGNVPAITAVSLLLALTATGLGLGLSLVVRTENMGIALTQVIALGGAIVAGLWMPLEFMPSFIQTISVGLPQYWAHQAFLDVMSRGATIVDIWPSLAMLLGFSMLGAFIAWLSYGRYVKHAN
ncbi:ABC transporter permease [Geomicrobium sp. JCM 19037]|uniref:ABC transporter permease n=1 Tax=Geomicrobium sp. JCM 19037 TaxID=1460634 RepID=UPI0021017DC3|nr:ABC transporter permease [Geomicrobium sp. JCM 19037]